MVSLGQRNKDRKIRVDDASRHERASAKGYGHRGAMLLAALATLTLIGCADLKYAECIARDRTSNPCN